MTLKNQNFGQAIEAMRVGKMVYRESWIAQGSFVFMQVPSEVPNEIIPKMTSLPKEVKMEAFQRNIPLNYNNQFAILYSDNTVCGWQATTGDYLANDWCILNGYAVAGETVGTAITS